MKKRNKISRILALVLTMSLVFQQAGITTFADDGTSEAVSAVAETELAAAKSDEATAASETGTAENAATAESSQEETSAPETVAAQEETSAPETGTTQKETTAVQAEASEKETAAQTEAAEKETGAAQTEAAEKETSAAQTGATESEVTTKTQTGAAENETSAEQTDTADKNSEGETDLEETTEAVTEAETKLAAKKEAGETSEKTAEGETETASEETIEAESETETNTEVETETDTEIETETETESEPETETETETETEEHPDTFVWEDDEKTVTVVLSDPEALPLGAEFVVEDLTQKEYDAYKALIIEQQFANDETYGETVEARTALAEVLLANLVLYDMYFVYEGTEIEPDTNTMSVTIKNKKAVDVSTDEVVESDGYVFVQEEDAESSVVAIHVDESGKKEKVEEVTEDVKTNANGKVKTVEMTVDSFSTIGYYPLTEYQQLPITDDTLINDWGGSYTLYFILNNYNIFTSGNALAQHTVGAVAVGGTSSFTYGIGASNYGTHPVPSYFQGGFVEGGFNSYIGGNALYFTGYDSNVYSWAYQSYDVRFNDGGTGTIDSSVTHTNGYFIDFTTAMAAITSEMNSYVNSSSNITVDITNTAATLEDDHYTVTYNGSSITVTVQSGYSYEFDDLDAIDYINIITGSDQNDENVNIISKESGTVVLPKVLLNGSDPTGSETDYGCGLVFMLPNATTVDIGSKSNGTFLGHVIAPNAAVESSVSGNTNGSFVCASFNVPSMENHMWSYNGSLITSDSHGFTAMKTLDNAAPTDSDDQFTFTLYELDATSGDWDSLQTATSTYGTGLVSFSDITYSSADDVGTHWYLISENTGDTTKYNFDTTLYLVKVVVTSETTGTSSTNTTYTATATYYVAQSGVTASALIQSSTASGTTTYSVDASKLSPLTLSSEDAETSEIFTFANTTVKGSLWITKNVTVNGSATTSTDADGTYTFYVKDSSGNTVRTIEITITNGVSETVEVTNLPIGTYTVEEDVSLNPTGMSLTGGNDISVTVTENGTASTSTASFTNNVEKVGSLKITKSVTVNGVETTGTAADGDYTFQIYYYNETTQASELKDTVTITIESGHSSTVQVDNLAEGKYYIVEVLSQNPYGMELVGSNSIVVEVKEENTGDAIPVASFTNNLTQTGSLKITKNVTVNGEPATDYDDPTVADGSYTFYIIQESTGITKADRTITIENGVSKTEQVDNLEPGWYIVREFVSGNPTGMSLTSGNDVRVYVYGDNTDDEGNTVINVAEFTNNKTEVGSLAITKSVTVNGDPASEYDDPTVADGTYIFYIVDENNNEVARTTAVIFNGESSTVTVSNLEPGTYYVYEELTSNPTGMTLTSNNNGTAVVVTANNTENIPTVEFVNNLEQVGSLQIKKNVTVNGEDPADAEDPTAADGTYTFYVVDESNNEVARKTLTIRNGVSNTVQIDNLEPGVYYVYEYLAGNPDGVTLTSGNGVQVTVEADNTTSIPVAEFTNDVEDVGSLIIQKNVTVNGDPATEYSDVTVADGTYTFYVVDESNVEVARRNITIVNGVSNTAQIDNLVPGVYYVYEYLDSNPSGMSLVGSNGIQVTVTADDTVAIPVAEFTNNKTEVGSLKITKNVTINGMDPTDARVEDPTAADGTYTFYVVDSSNNEVARRNITIVNGESTTETIGNLEPGVYYVYEYLTGHTDGATLVSPNGVEVEVEANNTSSIPTVSFTNDIEDVGSLKITKNVTVNGNPATEYSDPTAADGTYTFLVEDESGNEIARRNITIVNGVSKTEQIDNLIPGKYIVKEVTSSLPDDIALISTNGVEVTVTADDTVEIPTAEFTNNKYETEFTFTAAKKLTGRTLENGQFSFSITEAEDASASGTALTNGFTGTATNTQSGTISFPAVTYTTSGTYYYKIAETVPADADKAAGYTYDTSYYIVTVTVTNDADNDGNADTTLTAAITAVAHYDENGDAIDDVDTSNLAGSVVFTNEYEAEGTLTLTAEKSLLASSDSGVTLAANKFTFQVTGGKIASGSSVTATNNADGKVDFGTVDTYDETDIGKTYTYEVSEVIPTTKEEGYTYDTVVYTVTVEVVDNGNGTLTADIKSIKASNNGYVQEMEFENLYTDGSEIFLKAYKTLEGRTMTDGQFSFTAVEVTDATGTTESTMTDAYGETVNTYKSTVTNQAGEIIFDEISYEANDVGDHYYKISEEIPLPTPDGYTYDTSYYIVTVTVTDTDPATGGTATELSTSITAVVHYDGNGNDLNDVSVSDLADAAAFTNVYEASGDLSLEVTKTLDADEPTMSLTSGQFTFKITEIDQDGKEVTGGYTETKSNDEYGKVTFAKTGLYDESDAGKTYYYQIEEVMDPVNGFTYDTKVYTAAVTISDNGNGTLSTDITYTYSDGTEVNVSADSIAFTNSYETKGEITFTAAKTLNYRTLPNNLFTFNLVEVDDQGDEVTGGFSSSAKNDANGNVTFETISYTTSGTYYYKVSETIGNLSYYDYDHTVYMVTVEVTDNGEGVLTAVVTGVTKTDADNKTEDVDLEGATPTTFTFGFANTYLASGTLDLEAAKVLTTTETPLEAGQFTFEVSGGKLKDSVTATNDAKGKVTFTGVDTYDQTDIGEEYTYTVKEVIPDDAENNEKDGITYDTTEYTVTVKVVDQGRGRLGTEITYVSSETQTAVEAMTFSNTYTAEGQIYLKATKVLTDSTLADDTFTFTAVEADANGDEVTGGYSGTATNKAGTATFPVVTYEKSGTYYYKIAETDGGVTYYTYDGTWYIVEVTVTDLKTGELSAVITGVAHYDSEGTLIEDTAADANAGGTAALEDLVVFTNNYIAKGSLSVEATKVLNFEEPTMALTEGAFAFRITQVEADGSVTAGGYSETKTNDANGKVTFAKTDLYDQTDIGKIYYYTVEEVIPDPQVNGYTYDSKIYTVAVAISDNDDGTLETELTYTYSDTTVTDAQAESIFFTNTYATAGDITLTAVKTMTGRMLTADQFTFTITEVDADGAAKANGFTGSAANNAAGTITFPTISYTQSGTYYYQITEVNDGQSGYTYDSSIYTVTVTVTDNGAGSLDAEVTGVSKDGSAITDGTMADVVFTNTYTAAGSLTLKATKSMARTDSTLGTFEFVLTDVTDVTSGTGTVLQTVTNDTTGTITFAALEYTLEDAGKTYTYTVSENAQTGTGYLFDETIYTVTVTVTDNGDGTLALAATVKSGTGAETACTDTAMTFTNDVTSVKIRKIDVTTEEELPGATIQIIDENGTVIEEWVSTTEDHEVNGLIPGKTYTLRETVAPTGYDVTTDTTFVLNTDGTIDSSKTTTTVKDGVLLVEDSMTVSATATISVTKNLTYQNEAIDAVDQTFYVGLYVNAACTNLYASKAITFKNASSATVTFDGLEIGRTYYIAECDSTGAALASGVGTLADGTIFAADFGNGATTATATVTDGSQTTITFANEFYTMPGGFYKEGTLTITKKLLDPDGDAMSSSEVFYAGIFTDSSFTTLATNVSENIVKLDLAGSSSVSVEVGVSIGTGETVTLYVTEVDADGNPVADAADFAYEVSVDTTKVMLDETTTTATVTITNQEIEEVEEESEYEEETETETETETTAVQTGDDTPLAQYIVILILAMAIILMAVIYRRREREIRK